MDKLLEIHSIISNFFDLKLVDSEPQIFEIKQHYTLLDENADVNMFKVELKPYYIGELELVEKIGDKEFYTVYEVLIAATPKDKKYHVIVKVKFWLEKEEGKKILIKLLYEESKVFYVKRVGKFEKDFYSFICTTQNIILRLKVEMSKSTF